MNKGSVTQPSRAGTWPQTSGEMADLIRAHDWSATPLGPIEGWPPPLQTLVGTILSIPQAMWIGWGPEFIQIYNDAYRRLLDTERHCLALGRPASETWADTWSLAGPQLESVLDGGQPLFHADQPIAYRRDGEVREIYYTSSFSPIPDEAAPQGVGGVLCVAAETTPAALLRQSEERFRAIVETATDYAIFTTDPEGRIETWPPGAQKVFGWTADEAVGQAVDIIFTPEDRQAGQPAKEREEAQATGQAPNEHWHVRKDSSRVFIEGVVRPIAGSDGRPMGFLMVGQDVTQWRAAEERLQLATEAARIGIFDVDLATGAMAWDPRQRDLWGIGPDEDITDEIFLSGIHPDDRDRVELALARANDPGGDHLYAAEYRVRHCQHHGERWVAATGRVHFNGQQAVRLIGTVQDISERKRTEAALRKSEARLRDLNETLEQRVAERTAERDRVWRLSRDLFVVLGADGIVRAINPAVSAILGLEPREVVGHSFRRFVLPEDAELTQQAINEAAAGHDVTNFEARFYHRDGTLRWLSWHTSVEGDLVYAYGRDITGDKERQAQLEAAEAARHEADALYRAYFQNSAEGLFVIGIQSDGGFTIEEVNPAHRRAMAGLGLEPVRGRPLEEQLPPGAAEVVAANYRRVLETGEIQRYRESADIGGQVMHFETVLVPVRDETGRIVRIVGSGRDMTSQVQAEEALRQSQKMDAMGQLTGGVAHDFNNLLTPILGGLDRLQRRGVGDERDRRMIDGALQSAERARTLVQRLLAFARRQPLQPTAINVAELIQGMAGLVASTTGPQIRVAVAVEPGLPAALADANQLEMAVLNLAVNGRDAMPDGGTLRISATSDVVGLEQTSVAAAPGRYVCLSVADTGVGMDEATLARAVEPFFSTKGIGRGTGLGLSMVHGLASQLGGALTIQSKPGLGTNVELWLPVAEAEVAPGLTAVAVPDAQENATSGKGTVLLVDDEDLVRATVADMLADLGYSVTEAGSAEAALRLLDQGLAPDLLVTDHLMPGLTGTELAHTVRQQRPSLPVLIISGYAEVEGVALGLPRLTKPFRPADLSASLTSLARRASPNPSSNPNASEPGVC
ncbi:hybrid sensor histidine kinase/response regulator [Rubellimicrobium rubrum]|nr:PAS domain S-box protein [Rubellimicrobium rubrum]